MLASTRLPTLIRRAIVPLITTAVLVALPAGASGKSFTSITNAGQFRLSQGGFDATSSGLIDQLQIAYPPAPLGIAQVLNDPDNRPLSGLRSDDNRLPGNPPPFQGVSVTRGYGWNKGDNLTGKWTPQGLTGSADSGGPGRSQAISWYRTGNSDVRISFVNLAKRRYRHVLLVRPAGGGKFDNVNIHAGGIAWVGRYMYVADTGRGLRVFDTSRILQVPKGDSKKYTQGYKYLLPQVGQYDSTGTKFNFSYVALDRQNPGGPALIAGEYSSGAGAPIVSWPIDLNSGLVSSPTATAAYNSPFKQVQGALTANGRVLASSASGKRGSLYVGKPNQPARRENWGRSPEDLYRAEDGTIFSLTERKGERVVFGTRINGTLPVGAYTLRARASRSGIGKVLGIGGFKPQTDPSLAAATTQFGQPSSRKSSVTSCPVGWRAIGLRINFVDLGGGDDACKFGKAQGISAFGRRWQTERGLSVGDTVGELKSLYPGVARKGRTYRLVGAKDIFTGGGRYAVLAAKTNGKRVTSFTLFTYLAGE